MRQMLIAQAVHRRRRGLGLTVTTSSPDAVDCGALHPDLPVAGRIVDGAWIPPAESTASRMPTVNSHASCRGVVVDRSSNRAIVYESTLERDLAYILLADRRVASVHDQPPAVEFIKRDGMQGHHTFDFIAVTASGWRVAYAVKPGSRIQRSGILETIDLIRRQTGTEVADRFIVVSEQHLPRDKVSDACWILRARAVRNNSDVEAVAAVLADLQGSVGIRDLAALSGLPPARGWNAAVCLIDEGVLKLTRGPISDEALVCRSMASVSVAA